MKIIHHYTSILLFLLVTPVFFGCDDENPIVQKIANLDAYVGDWQGQQVVTVKSDASGDTIILQETLRLIVDNPSSGRFEVIDTTAMIVNQGSFTVVEVENVDVSMAANPLILQLISLVEDNNESYVQEVNGENVFYDYRTYNVKEISASTLVLTDATSDRDLITYTYTK